PALARFETRREQRLEPSGVELFGGEMERIAVRLERQARAAAARVSGIERLADRRDVHPQRIGRGPRWTFIPQLRFEPFGSNGRIGPHRQQAEELALLGARETRGFAV